MKNNEKLLDAIGNVSERFVPDMQEVTELEPQIIKHNYRKFAIAAVACFAVVAVVSVGIAVKNHNNNKSDITGQGLVDDYRPEAIPPGLDSDLQLISTQLSFGTMGMEALMAYDISELDTSNPYDSERALPDMPVYKNFAYADGCEMSLYYDEATLKEIADTIAEKLGIEIDDVNIQLAGEYFADDSAKYSDMIWLYEAICSGEKYDVEQINIRVFGDGDATVEFVNGDYSSGMPIPDEYSLTYSSTSDDEAIKTLEYLKGKFAQLLVFDDNYDISQAYTWGDRTYSGEQIRKYCLYAKSDVSDEKYSDLHYMYDLVNYSFLNAEFCPADNGNLYSIRLQQAKFETIGTYPTISEDDARTLLCSGEYYSSVPQDYLYDGKVSNENIKQVEVVYLSDNTSLEYFVPYYKFYVELDTEGVINDAEGLKHYGIFYVPCISSEYLAD